MVHADLEIEHDEDRRLQPVGEVESVRAELEASVGFSGNSSTCLVSPCEA